MRSVGQSKFSVASLGAMPIPATYDTFTISRHLPANPQAVFGLFADEGSWRRWFRMPGSGAAYEHDFRVGHGDHASSDFTHDDGRVERLENRAVYLAIDTAERIVFAYHAIVDGIPRWASLVTVELRPEGDGTELTWTEKVALLVPSGDGSHDLPHLRGAVRLRLNGLAAALTGNPG